jgi:hypothetical protein
MRDWPREASPEISDVRRWTAKGYRLGMVLDGLVAIDLDPAPAYYGLSAEFGDLPLTWMQETPRGGRHYLFSSGGGRRDATGGRPGAEAGAVAYTQTIGWRHYPEGQVDIKAGPGSYIVLYPERPGQLPNLRGVAALPERIAQALPRAAVGTSVAVPLLGWDELAERTRHYQVSETVLRQLTRDRKIIAATAPGSQNSTLRRMGYSWGKDVRSGFVGAAIAEGFLVGGGVEMANEPGREPWTQEQVRAVVRRGMLAGYASALS